MVSWGKLLYKELCEARLTCSKCHVFKMSSFIHLDVCVCPRETITKFKTINSSIAPKASRAPGGPTSCSPHPHSACHSAFGCYRTVGMSWNFPHMNSHFALFWSSFSHSVSLFHSVCVSTLRSFVFESCRLWVCRDGVDPAPVPREGAACKHSHRCAAVAPCGLNLRFSYDSWR